MKFCAEKTALLKMPVVYASTYTYVKYIKTRVLAVEWLDWIGLNC